MDNLLNSSFNLDFEILSSMRWNQNFEKMGKLIENPTIETANLFDNFTYYIKTVGDYLKILKPFFEKIEVERQVSKIILNKEFSNNFNKNVKGKKKY